MTKIRLFFLLVLCSYAAQPANFKDYSTEVNGIRFKIDPKLELYNIIAMQFGHNGMSPSNIPYKRQSLDYFEAFKGHEASKLLLQCFKNGWLVDDPMFFLLHLDKDFGIRDDMPKATMERAGGREQLEKLATAFKDYAETTGFYKYFNEVQADFYRQVLQQTAWNFRNFKAPQMLQDFFHEKADSYTLILNLMGGYGNFGKSIPNKNGFDCYAIVETNAAAGELPLYRPSVSITNLILHEFSHGFVNPKADALSEEFEKFSKLYEPIREAMKAQGYWQWQVTLDEHLVRAAVVEMTRRTYGKDLSQKIYYKKEIGQRFIYLDAILKRIRQAEKQPDKYPDFKAMIASLPEVFAGIDSSYIASKMAKTDAFREPDVETIPKPYNFARDSSTVFIIGTHETDSSAQEKMHQFVRNYRDMFSKEIRIISDDTALEQDLTNNDLVVFGTVEGNSFLKKYIDRLPVSISADKIVTNKVIPGKDLQLVTSWVSPFNKEKALVVYTAQRTADIKNFYQSAIKDQYNYWVARDLIPLNKGNYQRLGLIWLPAVF